MITIPTVLVLGAGASQPYGFPTGTQLWSQVVQEHPTEDLDPVHSTLVEAGFSIADIDQFKKTLRQSGLRSVDAFLENRPQFIEIGKLAMTTLLARIENEDLLYDEGRSRGWYHVLFGALRGNSFEEFGDNQLTIITYNYDRSLDHYLFNSLRNTYGKTEEECVEQFVKIPIIHLHGKLGFLPWEPEAKEQLVRGYQPKTDLKILESAAKAIHIIYEESKIKENSEFLRAKEKLSVSAKVIFLGFGYAEPNLDRLATSELTSERVLGTAQGVAQPQREKVYAKFPKGINLLEAGKDILDLLTEVDGLTG